MEKYYEEWNGEKFPVRVVMLPEELGGYKASVADIELWWAIENDVESDNDEAVELDNEIYYYCDSGFIASNPTDEEIISVLNDEE